MRDIGMCFYGRGKKHEIIVYDAIVLYVIQLKLYWLRFSNYSAFTLQN